MNQVCSIYIEGDTAISITQSSEIIFCLAKLDIMGQHATQKWLLLPQYTLYRPGSYVNRLLLSVAIFTHVNQVCSMYIEGAMAISVSLSCEIDFLLSKNRHHGPICLTKMAVATSIYIVRTWLILQQIATVIGNLRTYEPGLWHRHVY